MTRLILAAVLLVLATAPWAQTADVPKPDCGPKPEFPGRLAMQRDAARKAFDSELKAYRACMQAYIEARKAAADANAAAGNAAIEEYNAIMKKIIADQAAASGG